MIRFRNYSTVSPKKFRINGWVGLNLDESKWVELINVLVNKVV